MLEQLFLNLLEISIQSSVFVLVIVLVRLLFKNIPKQYVCFLWALLAVRLLIPVQITSPFSLVPDTSNVQNLADVSYNFSEDVYNLENIPVETTKVENTNDKPILGNLNGETVTEKVTPVTPMQTKSTPSISQVLSYVWIIVTVSLIFYGLIRYLDTKHSLREAVHDTENIWYCDNIPSPFVIGYIKPRIYIPYNVDKSQLPYVIAHEKAHIAHLDHLGKLIGYLLLCVYWFHPVIWLGYILYCRDLELACDERVLIELGTDQKKAYSTALLDCSVGKVTFMESPLAFSEVAIKERIKHILNYKKPSFWAIIFIIVIAIFSVVCFMTSAKQNANVLEDSGASSEISEELDIANLSSLYADQIEAFPGTCKIHSDGSIDTTVKVTDNDCAITTSSKIGETVYHWSSHTVKTYPLEIINGVIQDVPAKVITEDELLKYAFGQALLQMTYKAHPYGIKQYIMRDNGMINVNIGYEDDIKSFLNLQYMTFEISKDKQTAELADYGQGYYLLGANNIESLDVFRDFYTGTDHMLPNDTTQLPWPWLIDANGETYEKPSITAEDVPVINHSYDFNSFALYNIMDYNNGFTLSEKYIDGIIHFEYRYKTAEDDFIILTNNDFGDIVSIHYNGQEITFPSDIHHVVQSGTSYYASPMFFDTNGDGSKELVITWGGGGTGYLSADCEVYHFNGNTLERLYFNTDISEIVNKVSFEITEFKEYEDGSGTVTYTLQYENQSSSSTKNIPKDVLNEAAGSDDAIDILTEFFYQTPYHTTEHITFEEDVFQMGQIIHGVTAGTLYLGEINADYVWDADTNMFEIDMDTVTLTVF